MQTTTAYDAPPAYQTIERPTAQQHAQQPQLRQRHQEQQQQQQQRPAPVAYSDSHEQQQQPGVQQLLNASPKQRVQFAVNQLKKTRNYLANSNSVPSVSQITSVIPDLFSKATAYLPTENSPEAKARNLKRIQWVSRYLDSKYKVPFYNIKIGLDPLISAVPVVGDVISTALSCYVVYLCRRFDVPWWITVKMVFNVVLNATFGYVPVLGSAFDVAYKPNMRNLILLEEFLRKEAIAAGQDPTHIDKALKKSRSEVISFVGGEDEDYLQQGASSGSGPSTTANGRAGVNGSSNGNSGRTGNGVGSSSNGDAVANGGGKGWFGMRKRK